MSYINDNLMPNEKVLFSARVHWSIFMPPIILFFMDIVLIIYSLSMIMVRVDPTGTTSLTPNSNGMMGSFLLCFSGICFFFTIMLGIKAFLIMQMTEFGVTNRRVIAKTGFIRRHTLEMLLSKIESVSVNQNVTGRIFGFGTVTVTGTGGTRESFNAIVDPVSVRQNINQIIEQHDQAYAEYQRAKKAQQPS